MLKKSTVRTIFYALYFLKGVNSTIESLTGSAVRREQAIKDLDADEDAYNDFMQWCKEHEKEIV